MKNPKKPIHPHKVELPTDKVKFTRTHELYHNYKVADIIKMLPENYPLDEAKIVFEDADDSYDVARTYLEYETEEPNIHLNGQMKAYHRKIKTYAKKMVKYEAAMEVYRKEKAAFDTWFKIVERRRKIEDAKNRIIKAEKDLKRLK
jgi:hypothetical protein